MATKSKHRKGHNEKVAARNRQKSQEKAHQKHRLNKMIEQMIKTQMEQDEANKSNEIIPTEGIEMVTKND